MQMLHPALRHKSENRSMRITSLRACLLGVLFYGVLTTISAPAQLRQAFGQHSRYEKVVSRLDAMTTVPVNQWRYHVADIPHPEDSSLDDSNWQAASLGRVNMPASETAPASHNGSGWYRTWIEIPATVGGKDIRGARIQLALNTPSLARVFFNGSMVATGNAKLLLPVLITANAVPGQHVLVAVSTARLADAQLLIEYPGQTEPGLLRKEILSAEALLKGFPDGNAEREKQLDAAVQAIDLEALDKGDQQAFNQSLNSAQQKLEPLNAWMKQFTIKAVGNAHIDMAWEWPWTETVEVVRDTYTTALQLMREYPDFKYSQSSAQTFEWLEEKYPELFRQIQQRVKEGRWELVGGMWIEPDLNMPDGESMVRQLLVGKRYFQKKFGVDVNIGWNPDSFGYTWQLPQIYKKSGIDYFVTQKMSWNETTVFPYKMFWWQSPDGSRVLTYFPHNYTNDMNPMRLANDVATYAPATGLPELMHMYGIGDHGGGPTRVMLDEGVRLQSPATVFPKLTFSTAKDFFADVQQSIDTGKVKPPVWNDELYLEYHRGCYTTQSEMKKQIRHNEELLENAEKFASFDFLSRRSYPGKEFESAWKKTLFDEFHDIMPGSSIAVVYVDALRNEHEATVQGEKMLQVATDGLTARINTQGTGTPFTIFNPLSWERTGTVAVTAPLPSPGQQLEVRDSTGRTLPSQVVSTDKASNQVNLQVLTRGVPAMGYEVIHVVPVAKAAPAVSALKVSGTTLENEFLRVKIDPQTGCITSLVNKANNKETIAAGGCGNLLQAFVDKPPRQDAWEIKFDEQSWDLKQPQEVKVVESGPVRAVVRIKHKFQNSTFVQDVTLTAGVPRVDVDMQADWNEKHILLKVGVPVDVKTDKATFEIPYGTIERPTTRNTPAEKAKFEVPALRWGDMSDATHGLSLLNASKYGYDAKDNVLRLSLLRSPVNPDPHADEGHHEFTYALYPHAGGWESGNTMRQGYELNFPLISITAPAHTGPLPAKHSFAQIEPGNVILTAVKKAEDEDALIFRFYEFAGKQTQVRLHLADEAATAFETNLMEKPERDLVLQPGGHELLIPTGPFEIKTVKVSFNSEKR